MSKLDQYLSNGIKDNLKLSEMYVLMANQNMLFINEKQLDITC